MKNEYEIKIGKIQGFLKALSLFNTTPDHNYVFEIDILDKAESVEQTLHKHLTEISGVLPNSLKLTLLAKVETELQESLSRWIYHLADTKQHFTLWNQEWRRKEIAELVKVILDVARPKSAYKVEFHPAKWYECSWEDFALEGQDQVFFLHFGVSD